MKYLINDLAKLSGISTNAIRRYEKIGLLEPPRNSSNYRYYKDEDLIKLSFIRLYIKCGFSLEDIKRMNGSSQDDIYDIRVKHLNELDRKIERLKRLRHWLKDNIQLMDTFKEIGEGFYYMKNPCQKYVIISEGGSVFKEKGRLETIKQFLYGAPEVQLMQLFRLEDVKGSVFSPCLGWTLKESDIEKYNLEAVIDKNNPYIETYPSRDCLFSTLEVFHGLEGGFDEYRRLQREHIKKLKDFAEEKGKTLSGDVFQIFVSVLGESSRVLTCYPVKSAEKD